MTIITPIRAIIYYGLLILYIYMYNILMEILLYSHRGLYHKIGCIYAHAYLVLLKVVGVKIFWTGEKPQKKTKTTSGERILWISNHRSKLDGIMIQALLMASSIKVMSVVKNSIRYIPILGSIGKHSDSIFIKRKFDLAEKILILNAIKSIKINKSILLFPEGTTMSPSSKSYSDNYAKQHNLPIFNNILLPKTTGFNILQNHGRFDTVGNITLSYGNPVIPNIQEHSYINLFTIFPREIYINLKYESSNFDDPNKLIDMFKEKDKYLDAKNFKQNLITLDTSSFYIILNVILLIFFYYCMCHIPLFMYLTFAITLFSTIKIFL